MLVLVILLVVTNLASLGALAWLVLRPAEHPAPDPVAAASLERAARPAVSTTGSRRLITIEILNPIELAGTRGRLAGIAGSLAPGITRRIVYDQAIKMVKRKLADEQVVADVRMHVLRVEEVVRQPGRATTVVAEVVEEAVPETPEPPHADGAGAGPTEPAPPPRD